MRWHAGHDRRFNVTRARCIDHLRGCDFGAGRSRIQIDKPCIGPQMRCTGLRGSQGLIGGHRAKNQITVGANLFGCVVQNHTHGLRVGLHGFHGSHTSSVDGRTQLNVIGGDGKAKLTQIFRQNAPHFAIPNEANAGWQGRVEMTAAQRHVLPVSRCTSGQPWPKHLACCTCLNRAHPRPVWRVCHLRWPHAQRLPQPLARRWKQAPPPPHRHRPR